MSVKCLNIKLETLSYTVRSIGRLRVNNISYSKKGIQTKIPNLFYLFMLFMFLLLSSIAIKFQIENGQGFY